MPGSTMGAFEVRVGCDVQSIDEVRAAIGANDDRYLRRLLGDEERAEVARLATPDLVARYATGRFAAKEAVYKALRCPPGTALPLSQIEVVADEHGAPHVRLHGTAAELSAEAGIGDIAVSISHAPSFAFAVATAIATRG
jgi:holo-[acyl-carrier protein] synthase